MVSINISMQTDDSLDLFVQELNDISSDGMKSILERVRRDIVRFLEQRYGDQPQQKGHGFPISNTGYLETALREWSVVEDSDGNASLHWNGGQQSAVQEGEYVSTPWSQIYFINKGRKGWGGDNDDYDDVQGFTAYSEPRNAEGKIDLNKYLKRQGTKVKNPAAEGTFVSPRSAEMQHQSGILADKPKGQRTRQFNPDDLGAYRLAIYEWAASRGISQYWGAIANKIASKGSSPANPTLTSELFGSEFPPNATTGNLLLDIINDAVKDYLSQKFKSRKKGKMSKPFTIANVAINIRGRWQVASGQTITLGDKTYKGGQFLPKGTYGQSAQGFQIT